MIVESPCTGVCQLADDKTTCTGCHRTLSEIEAWSSLSDSEKLLVVAAAKERKAIQEAECTHPKTP
jgi:predicted Fe-S protein YdhL (DUF1289 family)